jgi:ABC-type multidrug transport system ATPase subunit
MVQQLSGGEQQRVAIAVALANRPRLLLADEPTGELDSASADTVYRALQEASYATKVTILLVTHDPEIASYVDRVVAIRDGRTSAEVVHHLEAREAPTRKNEEPADTATLVKHASAQDEFVLVDRFGRLQLPVEHTERLGLAGKTSRVRVHLEDDHLTIWLAEDEATGTGERRLSAWRAARQSTALETSRLKGGGAQSLS